MIKLALTALCASYERREAAACGSSRRRLRNRLAPDAESLEVRDCPSTLGLHPGSEHAAHSLAVAHHETHQVQDAAVPLKKTTAGAQTIYVAPTGKMGASAGKSAARPLGSLTLAIKRAKPGATIILAPGVYTQNVTINGKSGITIDGAANGSSILAAGVQGQNVYSLRVVSSSGVTTINNVSFSPKASGAVGLAIVGSTVNVSNIRTNGTYGDGVLVGQGGVLNANSSHFDQVQFGSGVELQPGSSATIKNSTFDGDGTGPNASTSSNGLRVDDGASATITGSEFNANTNAGLTAYGTAQVTVSQSTFSRNVKGDGALIQDQATVNFTGDTFSSNGVTVGEATGLNGLEFLTRYTGTAVVSGNKFLSNTANGVFIGGASHAIQVVNNLFDNNLVGVFMDSTVGPAPINATIQGNTIDVPAPTSDPTAKGIIAIGSGVTATIGGPGTQGNTLENYAYSASAPNNGAFIYESGSPNLAIQGNTFTSGGSPVPEADAIHIG